MLKYMAIGCRSVSAITGSDVVIKDDSYFVLAATYIAVPFTSYVFLMK